MADPNMAVRAGCFYSRLALRLLMLLERCLYEMLRASKLKAPRLIK